MDAIKTKCTAFALAVPSHFALSIELGQVHLQCLLSLQLQDNSQALDKCCPLK